jgi:hypothetical protein
MKKENFNKIKIEFISGKDFDNDNVGDYLVEDNELIIGVKKYKEKKWRYITLIHELIEALLVTDRGILIDSIGEYDEKFIEDKRKGQQGEQKDCPYHKEHMFATKIEKLLAKELNVDYEKYNEYHEC